jgi:phosphoribosyl-dephospho-CoA transferase
MTEAMSDARYRPHDLLKLRRCPFVPGAPEWVHDAFARAPFAVVRRAVAASGRVAVGMRGRTRPERYAAIIEHEDVEASLQPEQLVHAHPCPTRAAFAPFALLRALTHSSCLAGRKWGPAGSAAFELATGVPTITLSSDLDLLIRAPRVLSHEEARALLADLQACAAAAGIRIDVQLETPAGGVALAEWAMGKSRMMVKCAEGARLVADPWSAEPAHARRDE